MNTELDPQQASDAYEITTEQPGITPEKAYQDAVDGQKPQPFNYATPKVKKLLNDNLVAGGIISPEVEKYSDWERTWMKFDNSFESGRNQNAMGDDSYQIMLWKNDLQVLSDYKTQDDYKTGVKRLATEMQKSQAYSALNKPDDVFVNIPSGVSTAIYQMVTNVTDNPSVSGVGALVGLGTGGIPGAIKWGFTAGNTWGNFTKTAGSIYKEVILEATDEEFKKRNPKQVMYIALGTAAISAGLEAFANKELIEGATGKFLATKTGQSLSASAVVASIKKGLNGETLKLVASLGETIASKLPELLKTSGKYLGNAFMTQGLPEMGQELIEAKGTAMGKGQGLKFNKELGNQLANAGLIGTFTTPVADTGAIVLGNAYYQGVATIARKQDTREPLRVNMGEFQLREDLKAQKEQLEKDKSIITELLDIENKISTKNNPVHDEVTDALAVDKKWYVTKDALLSLEQNKAGVLKEFSRVTGHELTDENEIYSLSSKNLLRIAQYDAEITNKISHTPAGNTLETFETFTKKLDTSKEKVQKVLESKLINKNENTQTQEEQINELTTIIDSSTDGVFDVDSNVYRDTITTLVADRVMTEDEAQLYHDTVTEARVFSAEQTLEQERQETRRAIKLDVDSSIESIAEKIEDSINKDPGMKVEDFFDPSVPVDPNSFNLLREIFPEFKNKNDLEIQLDLLTKQKTKAINKYGIFAFDPETLPGDYKQLTSRQRAKDKLVFVKGGIDWKHADLIAQKIFGYRDGIAMLGTILNTPTKEEYRAEQYGYLKDLQTDESIKELTPQKEDFLKAFENKAKIYAKEIDFILKEKTGQARKLIAGLGKTFKVDAVLKRRAQTIAENVKMRDLNPNKFSRNQDVFQAKVTKAFADGDFFNMFQYKELQVLNALAEGYALDFRKRIERKSARVQMMGTKEGQKLLYAAGPEFVQAYNFLKGALDGRPYATSQVQDLIELYKPYTGTGIGPEFGQRIIQPRDTKVQQGDLNYKEVSAILDTMIGINSLAKRAKSVKVGEQTVSMIEAQRQISLLARTNPLYDSTQSESLFNKDYDEPVADVVMDQMGSVTAMFTTIYTTIQNRLDQGDITGFFSNTFIVPLVNGLSTYGTKNTQVNDYLMLKVKETIGLDAFNKLPTERVNIPEFSKRYKNGLSRFELLATTAHAMSESGRKKMTEQYGITDQQLLKVIEDNVTDKELELIQSMMNYHESEFFKNIYDRYIRLGQVPPEKVTALPTKIRGKEYAGGYWPLKKESEIYNKTKRMNQEITDVIKNKEIGKMLEPTDVVTKSGTEKERTDATGPYDLTFEGYMYKVKEMIHHDTFSETMINISNLLANDSIVNDMMNVMGKEQFTAFVASLEHFALGSHDFDIQAQVAMEPGRKILNFMTRNLNVAKMGGGIKTAARQYNSYGVMIESLVTQLKEPLSVDSAKAASSTIWNTVLNPMKLGKLAEAIAVVDPQFKNYVDSLKKLPMYKAAFGKESVFDVYATNQSDTGKYARKTQDFFMGHLQFIQLQLNTAAYMTAFNFAMDGKIKNIDKGDKKSARDFASTMVRITLSDDSALGQSAIQRQWWGKLFLFGQNQLNIVTNRAIGAHMRMGFARNQNGFDLRNKAFMSGLMTIVMAGVVPSILETALGNLYKNIVVPEEDKEEEKKGAADKTVVAGLKGFLNLYPGFRSFAYDIEQITEQDKDMFTLNSGNIYANSLTNVTSFVGSTLWAAHDSLRKEEEDRHRVSQNEIKTFTRSILDLSGIAGFNAPPIPYINPTGKNLRNTVSDAVIEKWFSDHPRRYDFSILSYNEPSDDRPKNIVDIITEIANDKNETVLAEQKPKEQADDVFIAAVEELQKPNLTYEQKQIQSAIRDRAYSVNGITNPEGHKITTNKGDVDLSDFRDREKITLWVRGLSRFETKDFTAMMSSSGASGYFHFTKGTWNLIKDQYPELNLPKTPLDASEAVQNQAYWKLLGENMIDLERLNQSLSLENIYLIHMMGFDDYKKFVQSNPGDDLEKILPVQYEYNRGIVQPGTVQGIKDNVKDKLLDHIKEAYEDLKTENLLTP